MRNAYSNSNYDAYSNSDGNDNSNSDCDTHIYTYVDDETGHNAEAASHAATSPITSKDENQTRCSDRKNLAYEKTS